MRRLLGLAAVVAATLTSALPAYAGGSGQIDHIETLPDGDVHALFSMPGLAAATAPDLDSVRVTVNGTPAQASASPVRSGEIERTAVLALDVSESMRGARFVAAKRAAVAYLRTAPEDVSVGLVTFAGAVKVISSPTVDHEALIADVESLALSGGTLLYDATLEAIRQAGTEGARQVLLLSDGADTGSTPLTHVVEAAKDSGVAVNAVALQQSAANTAKLRQITTVSGGSVLPADDPQALAQVFTTEAEALAQQVLVQFTARGGDATVAISLEAAGQVYRDSAFTTLTVPRAPRIQLTGPVPVAPEPRSPFGDERLLYIGAGAVGLGLANVVAVLFFGKPRRKESLAERHLAHYAQRSVGHQTTVAQSAPVNIRDSAVALAEQVVSKGDFEERLTTKLTGAGITLTAAEWLLTHAGIAVGTGLLGLLLSGGNLLVIFLLMFFGATGPWLFLSLKRSRRVRAFNAQLADTLQLMSGGLSAGLSLAQAVDTVVREGAEPMAGELRRALVEQRLGVEIEEALEGVADRMDSDDFAWVVMAIRIQREVGGNLAELLNTVSGTLREREYLRRQVSTLSAEGRLSAWILGGLPPAFVSYLALAQPDYLKPMVTTSIGWAMSGLAVVMLMAGAFWLAKTVKVEV